MVSEFFVKSLTAKIATKVQEAVKIQTTIQSPVERHFRYTYSSTFIPNVPNVFRYILLRTTLEVGQSEGVVDE